MGKKSDITRAKLIDTAKQLFLEKGFDGLKMQELADRAGMNKGLLHYYFKSKQVLFKAIFQDAMQHLFSGIIEELLSGNDLNKKMHNIVDLYFDKLKANPGLPVFILSEIHKNPSLEGLPNISDSAPHLINAINNSVNPKIDQIRFLNLLLTVVSLSVFPFVARPLFIKLLPDSMQFEKFMEQRRIYIKKVVSQLIKEL